MSARDRKRRTLIAYDIPDDRRRTRVAKLLEQFGDRIQYSVFVVDLLPGPLIHLKSKLRNEINGTEDSVLLCDLGLVASLSDMKYAYIGIERDITGNGPIIV